MLLLLICQYKCKAIYLSFRVKDMLSPFSLLTLNNLNTDLNLLLYLKMLIGTCMSHCKPPKYIIDVYFPSCSLHLVCIADDSLQVLLLDLVINSYFICHCVFNLRMCFATLTPLLCTSKKRNEKGMYRIYPWSTLIYTQYLGISQLNMIKTYYMNLFNS